MGLFKKDSPAEKKLKKLTGGFLLSTDFINLLKSKGLEIEDGTKIKNQLKEEIKEGKVNEGNLQVRLNQLIKLEFNRKNGTDSSSDGLTKQCPKCHGVQDIDNSFCINCGYKFSTFQQKTEKPEKSSKSYHTVKCPHCSKDISPTLETCPYCNGSLKKTCPKCSKKLDIADVKCIRCGYDFTQNIEEPKAEICPNCEVERDSDDRFCINCGYDFENKKMPEEEIKCPNCGKTIKSKKKCPHCNYDLIRKCIPENLSKIKEIKFLANQKHNLKTCPECNTQFLKQDEFCFKCGASVVTQDTVKQKTEQPQPTNELSDLEALYNQTVQSKYAPSFKVAYVLYLEEFRKNPTKKFADTIAKRYETTPKKLQKQALEDEFIQLASPLVAAKDSKVSELKDILKAHDLKVSGKKAELIERLGENLSEDELKKYFKAKNYEISSEGLEFLLKNSYIIYICNTPDISNVFDPSRIGKVFEEREYSQEDIYDNLLNYLKRVLDEKQTNGVWIDYKRYANAIAQVLEDKSDLKEALNLRFKVFLFDINNVSTIGGEPDPRRTKLRKKDVTKLIELLHNLSLSIDELKVMFEKSYNEVLFKTAITKEDSLIYLLKVFGGEDLDTISTDINESYSNPY